MKYNIHVTQAAERDMANAYDYIDLVLKNPTAADKLLDVADEKIGALAEFPHKFEVVSDKLLSLWGIRFTIVMNYLAFYTVDDATQTVHIVRFLYGKSNWITILKTDAANGSLPVFSKPNILPKRSLLWALFLLEENMIYDELIEELALTLLTKARYEGCISVIDGFSQCEEDKTRIEYPVDAVMRIMPVGSEIWPEECEPLLKKIGAETIGDVADYLNKNESENSSADDVLSTALLKICYENMDMDGKMVFWEDMLENNSLEWRDVE